MSGILKKALNKILFEFTFLIFWIMFQRSKNNPIGLDSVKTVNLERAVKVTKRNEYINDFFSSELNHRKHLEELSK